MKITRTSMFSGLERTKEFDIREGDWYKYDVLNMHIQDCMPYLTPSEREFILTGTTDDEWDEMFGDDK